MVLIIRSASLAQLKGKNVDIALPNQFDDRVVPTDVNRDQGLLTGRPVRLLDRSPTGR